MIMKMCFTCTFIIMQIRLSFNKNFRTMTCFEMEAKRNSEMEYWDCTVLRNSRRKEATDVKN